ncbi:MAG: gluconate 2-dehydrogenase subunit 3 family protein [Parafilimonas sp.]
MSINRRSAIKYFVIVSAGAALLPTCKPADKKTSAFGNIPIDEDQQVLLAEMMETIIPGGTTPGAKEVSAQIFALQMLNDCYEQNDRDKFIKGMQQFQKNVKDKYHKSFTECTAAERNEIITTINAQKDAKDEATFFYKTLKQLTIRGYSGSRYYLTNVQVYKLVPGKFKASVPV